MLIRPSSSLGRRGQTEVALYGWLAVFWCVVYLAVLFFWRNTGLQPDKVLPMFGIAQYRQLFADSRIPALLLILLVAISTLKERVMLSDRRVLVAVGFAAVFFALRTNCVNYDGMLFTSKFMQDVPLHGAHVTHDEMLELYLHSRIWFYANLLWGWSVPFVYQLLSSLAGGVFVYLLLGYARLLSVEHSASFFWLCLSGGYVQLFFGEIENYTFTAVCILAYCFLAARYVRHEVSLWQPSLMLAVALSFHLLAGFLLPSLFYLGWIALRRAEHLSLVLAVFMFVVVIAAVLAFFHFHGLPIHNLWAHSHALGHGGNMGAMLVVPSVDYYKDILNLVCLLMPVFTLLLPLGLCRGLVHDDVDVHLVIACAGMTLFLLIWRAGLGVYQDWNLFAAVALPYHFLVARAVLRRPVSLVSPRVTGVMQYLFMGHSLSWVLSNHFYR